MKLSYGEIVVLFFITMGATKAMVVLMGVTHGHTPAQRRRIASRAALTAAVVLMIFAVIGQTILHAFHVSLAALTIAGGLILFVFALGMVLGGGEHHAPAGEGDVSIYPLAVPLLATPQGIVAIVVIMTAAHTLGEQLRVFAALLTVIALNFVLMRYADSILRRLRPEIMLVAVRVVALLLAALAVQLVIFGLVMLGVLPRSVLPATG